jgi:hypothetical protein
MVAKPSTLNIGLYTFPNGISRYFTLLLIFCHMLNPIMGNRLFLFRGMNDDRGFCVWLSKEYFFMVVYEHGGHQM